MSDAILLLRLEHSNMARLLDWVDDQIQTLESGTAPDYTLLNQALYYLQNYPDLCHHPKEDLVLESLALRDPEGAATVGDLSGEHRKLAEQTGRVAAAVNTAGQEPANTGFVQALRELVVSYRRHMSAEEEHFFPLALKALQASDWESIDFELFDRDDPLFDHSQEQRFRKLREGISRFNSRYHVINAAQKELAWLQNLTGIDEFNHTMQETGSRLRLVGFTEGGYGVEREGKLLAYIPSYEEVQALWCAYYYAKGAEEIDL
jgi:hemerythrin-like domain-containing protein